MTGICALVARCARVSVTRLCQEDIYFLTQQMAWSPMMSAAAPHWAQLPGEVPNGMPRYHRVSMENSNALKLKPNSGDGSDDQTLLGELEIHVSRHFSQSGRELKSTASAFL